MLAFTTDELVKAIRSDLDDKTTAADGSDFGCLWSDADLYRYLTGACDALAKKLGVLYKTLRLPVTAGVQALSLPAYVTNIREARLVNGNDAIKQVNANGQNFGYRDDYGLKTFGSNVIFEGTGQPTAFVRDYDRKAILLVPTPVENDILELQVETTISLPQEAGMPLPFADAEDQQLLMHYVMWRAYCKHDADTEDLTRANYHEARYIDGSDERKSSLLNYRRKPPVMRMNW